jgi:hypothetical protein
MYDGVDTSNNDGENVLHDKMMAICKDRLIIVTVYLPNEDEWINSRRRK